MAHQELDELLNALFGMAERLLAKQGAAFLPVGAIMLSHGEIRHVGAQVEGEEYPGAQPVLAVLNDMFRKLAAEGKLKAAGVAYDVVTVPPGRHEKQDAICCSLEHFLGDAFDVFKPYARSERGDLEFGEIFSNNRVQQYFCDLPRG